jgi:hypothetical protein
MADVFQSQIEPKQGLLAINGQNAWQIKTPTSSWRLFGRWVGRRMGGWGNLSHAIELTHRAISEFDLDQMAKGCCAAFWNQSNQKKTGRVLNIRAQ